ncbi:MAG TPA: ROK family protein [Lacipirellulaceae bacterium]|nr:ROK family protein [Lacipirellulaceae bacterium]
MPEAKTRQKAVTALESALIQRVRFADGLSRIELAREMRLAPSTIGLYVDRLIADGVLREGQKGRSSTGRPPTFLELNPHVGEFVGIDFEARQISAASIDFSQDLLRHRHEKILSSDSADDVVEKIKRAIPKVTGRKYPLLGIGIGVPGTVDNNRGIAVHYEFIRGWRNIPLAEHLAQEFGVPVYLENNIRAMALAERWFGGARDVENFVCLGIRSGIGTGVVIDGKLHRGAGNMAGEIGGWPCPPGEHKSNGRTSFTLEHNASVRAILQHLTDAVREGANTSLTTHAHRAVGLEDMLRAAHNDDQLVTKVLRTTAEYVGRTVCQINLLLSPELIVIAGPLAGLDRAFLQPVREIVERLTPRLHGRVPRIVASQIGEFGGALGAAALAVHHWRPATH